MQLLASSKALLIIASLSFSTLTAAEKLEQEFDYLSLIDECIENREVMWIKENDIPNELVEFL